MSKKAKQSNLYLYNFHLKEYARKNRNASTKAESCLWKYVLRASNMNGYSFLRQRPVLNYIADFMCKELKLIIEADGLTHTFEQVAKNDLIRQNALEKVGFKVLRFTDDEVLTAINRVRDRIEDCIRELEKR